MAREVLDLPLEISRVDVGRADQRPYRRLVLYMPPPDLGRVAGLVLRHALALATVGRGDVGPVPPMFPQTALLTVVAAPLVTTAVPVGPANGTYRIAMLAAAATAGSLGIRRRLDADVLLQAQDAGLLQHPPLHLLDPPLFGRLLMHLDFRQHVVAGPVPLARLLLLLVGLRLVRVRGEKHLEQGGDGGVVPGAPDVRAT